MPARKIFLRFAQATDIDRLTKDGVVSGPHPARETWNQRIVKWLAEQRAGRRLVLVAEDQSGLLGMVQLVLKFPAGYEDPEAANGYDIAMMEGLRILDEANHEAG